jgi:hypothetical protein
VLRLVEGRFGLLALVLYLLTYCVILRLDFAQFRIGGVPLLLQLLGIIGMSLTEGFEPFGYELEGLGDVVD